MSPKYGIGKSPASFRLVSDKERRAIEQDSLRKKVNSESELKEEDKILVACLPLFLGTSVCSAEIVAAPTAAEIRKAVFSQCKV